MAYDIRTEMEVPVEDEDGARRVVGQDEHGIFHVVYLPAGENEGKAEVTFDMSRARGIAEKVMAGSARTLTAHSTLRILAAAVLLEAKR